MDLLLMKDFYYQKSLSQFSIDIQLVNRTWSEWSLILDPIIYAL